MTGVAGEVGHPGYGMQVPVNNKGHDPYLQMDQAEEDRVDIFNPLNAARETMNRVYRPSGKKSSPGKTCADIKEAFPESKNGEYYIDPNEGEVDDAIKVYCKFDTDETCVAPKKSKFGGKQWATATSSHGQYFMEELVNGREFDYSVDDDQLSFLQLLTTSASQTVTYNCLNSSPTGSRLEGSSGEEMLTSSVRHKRVTQISVHDNCKRKDNTWRSAEITVNTTRTELLPIVDMVLLDVGQSNQQFGVELGMACFS